MQREQKRKRPRDQQESPRPPYPVVTNCDEPSNTRRFVKDKQMRRTIIDYFKMSTGEHSNVEEDCLDLWGSSGDREFFEKTSDQVLATWEEYTDPKVTSPRTRLDQSKKETTGEQYSREDPTETGLGCKGTQEESLLREVSTLEDYPTMIDEDDLWMEELVTVGKYKEDDRKEEEDDLGEEDDQWVSHLNTDVDCGL